MLDQLRAMGVFACVVEKSSFSGAARELGITTSAVSQQIRSLENDMEVTLLHRSTRKLSLTEAGQAFFHSCQEMLAAAERGKIRINELRDDLVGDLRIATTPELGANHVIPALSHWMSAHRGLAVHIEADNQYIDLIEGRIDIALRMSQKIDDQALEILMARPVGTLDKKGRYSKDSIYAAVMEQLEYWQAIEDGEVLEEEPKKKKKKKKKKDKKKDVIIIEETLSSSENSSET